MAVKPAVGTSQPAEPAHHGVQFGQLGLIWGRPMLVAIAAFNAIFGLAAMWILLPLTFGSDTEIYRRGAIGIQQGYFAEDFLYPPLTGILATPLTWVPLPAATLAMAAGGLIIIGLGLIRETPGVSLVDRALVLVAVLGFLPVTYELITGQVTLLIAAAIYPLRDRDGMWRGLLLGVAIALFAKPVVIPLLIWMLLWRRRALLGTITSALVVTAVGILVLGQDIYRAWIAAVRATGEIERPGNLALTVLGTPALVVGLGVLIAALAMWAMVRDERRGFVAALVAALLIAPFTLMYQVSILLLAVRPALALAPRATRVLALLANPAILAAFIPWCAAALLAVVPRPRRRTAP